MEKEKQQELHTLLDALVYSLKEIELQTKQSLRIKRDIAELLSPEVKDEF